MLVDLLRLYFTVHCILCQFADTPDDFIAAAVPDMDTEFFTSFLSQALSLVVGVEFVKMLCQHSAQTVVEVLMFATARQMVVEHLGPNETLLGVISIAILFGIRKYLMTDNDDMNSHKNKDTKEH